MPGALSGCGQEIHLLDKYGFLLDGIIQQLPLQHLRLKKFEADLFYRQCHRFAIVHNAMVKKLRRAGASFWT